MRIDSHTDGLGAVIGWFVGPGESLCEDSFARWRFGRSGIVGLVALRVVV